MSTLYANYFKWITCDLSVILFCYDENQDYLIVTFQDVSGKEVVEKSVHLYTLSDPSLCLNFFHLLAQNPNLEEKKSIYSSKFFHNFHLSWASVKWVSSKTVINQVLCQLTCNSNIIFLIIKQIYFSIMLDYVNNFCSAERNRMMPIYPKIIIF